MLAAIHRRFKVGWLAAYERHVPLRLKVLKVNPAKGFYERLGFSVEEETEHFFCMQNAT